MRPNTTDPCHGKSAGRIGHGEIKNMRCGCRDRVNNSWRWWALRRLLVNLLLLLAFVSGLYLLLRWDDVGTWLMLIMTSSMRLNTTQPGATHQEKLQQRFLLLILAVTAVVVVSVVLILRQSPWTRPVSQKKSSRAARRTNYTPRRQAPPQPISSHAWKHKPIPDPTIEVSDRQKDTNTSQAFDKHTTGTDRPDKHIPTNKDQNVPGDTAQLTKTYAYTKQDIKTPRDMVKHQRTQVTRSRLASLVPSLPLDEPRVYGAELALIFTKDGATQTECALKPSQVNVGTMTTGPRLATAAVNTHQGPCRIVKNFGTMTSGAFMKKLRRAQRLLREAKRKAKEDKQDRVSRWSSVMARYKYKLSHLSDCLEKKDRLIGFTALSRAGAEEEVKGMYSALRSSRDRLQTQCRLNVALKEVVDSKCEGAPSTSSPAGQ